METRSRHSTSHGDSSKAAAKFEDFDSPKSYSSKRNDDEEDEERVDVELRGAAGLFMRTKSSVDERDGWAWWRVSTANLLESEKFEYTMGILIVINAVLVVFDTDYRADTDGKSPTWLTLTMYFLLAVYIVELLLRLSVYRSRFFRHSLNVFDFVVISVDALSAVLEAYGIGVGVSVSILRILRIGRLLRFVKVFRIFHELYVMLHLMMSAMRAITWGAILMGIMMTMWSIIAVEMLHPLNKYIADNTDAYDGCERCGRAFSSVMDSNLTFFQTIIAGDGWGQVSITLIEHYPLTAVLLITVVLSIDIGLMNLIVTVIVDKAQEAREENAEARMEEKRRQFKFAKSKMKEMCHMLDDDDSGQLTLDEFISGFRNIEPFRQAMQLMDVVENDLSVVFSIMDEDGSGTVSCDEFVEQLHKMKTQNTHTTIVFIRAYVKEIRTKVEEQLRVMKINLREQIQAVDASISKLNEKVDNLAPPNSEPTGVPPRPEVESKLVHAASSSVSSSKLDGRLGPHDAPHLPEADHTAVLFKLHRQVEEQLALEMRNSEMLARIAGFNSISEFDSNVGQRGTLLPIRSEPRHPTAAPEGPPPATQVHAPASKSTWFYRSPLPGDIGRCCHGTPPDDLKRV